MAIERLLTSLTSLSDKCYRNDCSQNCLRISDAEHIRKNVLANVRVTKCKHRTQTVEVESGQKTQLTDHNLPLSKKCKSDISAKRVQ